MSSKKPNGRHHFVPQFYLRQWADENEKVWQYGFDGRPPIHVGIKNIAFERGLYTHPAKDKVTPLKTEDDLAEIESGYAEIWPGIIDRAMNIQTRHNIARFIALMFIRHPQRRETVRMMNETWREIVQGLATEAEVEITAEGRVGKIRVQDVLDETKNEFVGSGFLKQMRETLEHIAKTLMARRWGIVFSEKPAFVTSDCPVVLDRGSCQRQVFGFRTPDTLILFPCSPTRLLVISDDWPQKFAHYKLTNADVFNRIIAEGAVRFIYGREHDLELAKKIKEWGFCSKASP